MNNQDSVTEELQSWIRAQLDAAVQTLTDKGVFKDAIVQVKPAWALPHRILIGKAREPSNPKSFRWFICGELQFDHLESTVANTPREALRHFAMKWQIDATRATSERARELIEQAEAVYPLADDEQLWAD